MRELPIKELIEEEIKTKNSLSQEFTFWSLIKFAFPTIIMMLFTSMYTVVDGIFVSRLINTDALSAVNIVYPMISIIGAIAVMFGTGGSAIIARKMGEGDMKTAKESFSLIVFVGVTIGVIIAAIGLIFINKIIYSLGASDVLSKYCFDYLWILLLFAPAAILQMLFQSFFITAGKPTLGLIVIVFAGVINAIFDYIFMGPMNMGISGAALATSMGFMIPSVFGMVYFARKKDLIYFVRPALNWKVIIESCKIGSAEMVTQLSTGIVTFLFNILMMNYLGEDGIAAITIVMYTQFVLIALYLGFSLGVAPVISYNYGSNNTNQLKRIFKTCMIFIGGSSIAMFGVAMLFLTNFVSVFSPSGTVVYDIAIRGFFLFSFSYLFVGFNIFIALLFTALSNGKIALIISLSRTLIFVALGLALLTQFLQVDGVWLAIPFAEILTIILCMVLLKKENQIYHYM